MYEASEAERVRRPWETTEVSNGPATLRASVLAKETSPWSGECGRGERRFRIVGLIEFDRIYWKKITYFFDL